jgi:hypothetical protein
VLGTSPRICLRHVCQAWKACRRQLCSGAGTGYTEAHQYIYNNANSHYNSSPDLIVNTVTEWPLWAATIAATPNTQEHAQCFLRACRDLQQASDAQVRARRMVLCVQRQLRNLVVRRGQACGGQAAMTAQEWSNQQQDP